MEAELRKIAGPAFALVREGSAIVRDGRGRLLRLERGDLLSVGAAGECSLATSGPRFLAAECRISGSTGSDRLWAACWRRLYFSASSAQTETS